MNKAVLWFTILLHAISFVEIKATNGIKKVAALNIANLIFDDNRLEDVSNIMDYYDWSAGEDGLEWFNRHGDRIKIIVEEENQDIKYICMLTSDVGRLSKRLEALQYIQANDMKKEVVLGLGILPKDMYVCGRKRVAVYPQGRQTLIIFFRSIKQGNTRYGPERNN